MNLNSYWRQEYDSNRYLYHLTIDQLSERSRYLIENLTTLESNGKIGLLNPGADIGKKLWRLFTHVLQEQVHRGISFSDGFMTGASVPKPAIHLSSRLIEINNLANTNQPHIFKFGEMKYLQNFNLKISLAKCYKDHSLNPAQMDDEMKAEFYPPLNSIKLTDMNGNEISGIESFKLIFTIDREYYIFCSSYKFDYRLFGDFGADSCLFIYDSQRFTDELFLAVNKKVELIDYAHKKVCYRDPVLPEEKGKPQIEFYKHIKYLYQNEFRHVLLPTMKTALDEDIFITLPTLSEYSELVCL